MDIGLLILRVVVGLTLAAHGAPKLFGRRSAVMAGLGETGGGVSLALGMLTPFASAVILVTTLVAVGSHPGKGFFQQKGRYEYPMTLAAIALGFAFTGPGNLSLDATLGLPVTHAPWGFITLGLGLLGALAPLVVRDAGHRERIAIVLSRADAAGAKGPVTGARVMLDEIRVR